jgi:hypothetical protein
MEVEIFSPCESASIHEEDDSLSIRGIIDHLETETSSPAVEDFMIAVRLRFTEEERGKHRIQISVLSPHGKLIGHVYVAEVEVHGGPYGTALVQIHNLRFDESGVFRLVLQVNGLSHATRFLHVRRLDRQDSDLPST